MMENFLSRPKRKPSSSPERVLPAKPQADDEEEPTEFKLALLTSLYPDHAQDVLLDVLIAHDGSVPDTLSSLAATAPRSANKVSTVIGYQQSLRHYAKASGEESPQKKRPKSRKGSTLHLYSPNDVAEHTPCTIIHNFLPNDLANDLLQEMLEEAKSFEKNTFKLFDDVVSSPHTSSFFVESYDDIRQQKTEYLYNGATLTVSSVQSSSMGNDTENRRMCGGSRLSLAKSNRSSRRLSMERSSIASEPGIQEERSSGFSLPSHGYQTRLFATATMEHNKMSAGTVTSSPT